VFYFVLNKKVLFVIGSRPEVIKRAPFIKKIEKIDNFGKKDCIFDQHRELLYTVLQIFRIIPRYDLNILNSKQTIIDITITVLE
jgi:UDP-N-acetylglucosamine 2-epimerase (non-hydrolysing)